MVTLLGKIRKQMNGAVLDTFRYYGAKYGMNYGVAIHSIREMAAEQGTDHDLAKFLYRQQVRELQIIALWIADAACVDSEELDFWRVGIVNSEIAEQAAQGLLCNIADIEKMLDNWCSGDDSIVAYNYCDEHGIMVWQDFGLACGHYPDDERLCKLVKQEVKEIAIALRNHPSLTLWAGDNECDSFVVPYWQDGRKEGQAPAMLDPNLNKLTRDIILKELRNHDATRTYLPSSPYIDEVVYQLGLPAEDHRWGPRDYFKGEFYGSTNCHFASEIGYHGCPSPKSVEKFIPVENLPKKRIDEINTDPAWLVHAAGMETQVENNPYAYRLPLMISQVERIFTAVGQDLDTFARQSQISQGEAMKFFIELFRSAKWRKTGILWWNIADGWPQISDAIVDWYGCKKIGYHYIKRSQTPLCIMCREPKNSMLTLIATNDTQEEKQVAYTVENMANGETVKTGSFTIGANGICEIGEISEADGAFYLIKWTDGKVENYNHFTCKIGDKWDFEKYAECMKKAGFYDEFEGF